MNLVTLSSTGKISTNRPDRELWQFWWWWWICAAASQGLGSLQHFLLLVLVINWSSFIWNILFQAGHLWWNKNLDRMYSTLWAVGAPPAGGGSSVRQRDCCRQEIMWCLHSSSRPISPVWRRWKHIMRVRTQSWKDPFESQCHGKWRRAAVFPVACVLCLQIIQWATASWLMVSPPSSLPFVYWRSRSLHI